MFSLYFLFGLCRTADEWIDMCQSKEMYYTFPARTYIYANNKIV